MRWESPVQAMLILLLVLAPAAIRAAPPLTPSGLQVGGFPGAQIRIAWTDNASNETSLRIERSANTQGSYALLTTLPANTTVYTDTVDTTYWYRMQTCNADGCSCQLSPVNVPLLFRLRN